MHELALVTWLDATRTDEAVTGAEQIGIERRTVGWLLRNDAEGVILAMSYDDGAYERGFTIPRAYVVKVKKLGDWDGKARSQKGRGTRSAPVRSGDNSKPSDAGRARPDIRPGEATV